MCRVGGIPSLTFSPLLSSGDAQRGTEADARSRRRDDEGREEREWTEEEWRTRRFFFSFYFSLTSHFSADADRPLESTWSYTR